MVSIARSRTRSPGRKRPGELAREETHLQSDELALLLKITNGFNSGWAVDEILDTMFEEFHQILPYDRMEYAVIDDDGYVLTTEWVRANYDASAVPAGFAYRRDQPIRGNAKYRVTFLDNELPAYASDRPPDHPVSLLVKEGVKCSLNCPLMVGDEVMGYLFFNTRHDVHYTIHHASLIQLIAGQLASILGQSRLNDQLRARNRELRALEQSRLEFIASISHELRTPLTAVVGFASELHDRVDEFTDEEITQFSSVIAAQSIEVAGLVEDLLVITRAEAGYLAVTPAPVNVAAEVRRVSEPMPHDRDEQEISLDISEAVAWADSLRVRQIIRNLLSNAGRYGGPKVRFTVNTEGDHVLVTVADNGPGVLEEDRELIFQAYGRSHASAGRTGSIGLGLTVSRYLAEAMDGSLTYERVNAESIFSLILPVYRPRNGRYARVI